MSLCTLSCLVSPVFVHPTSTSTNQGHHWVHGSPYAQGTLLEMPSYSTLSDSCWDNLQNSSEHSSCFYDMSSLCVHVPAMHVCMYACSCSGGKGYTPRGRKRGEVRPSSAPWQTGAKVHTYNVLKRIHPKSKQTAICGLTYHNITQHDITTGHSPRE